jgi:hypothetical protein
MSAGAIACGASPSPGGGGAASGSTCDQRRSAANAEIADAVKKHAACTADSDCAVMSGDTDCSKGCGSAANQAGAADIAAAVQHAQATSCNHWVEDGCPQTFAPPCVATAASCVSGQCALGMPQPPTDAGAGGT